MTTSKPGLFDELPETSFAGDQDADFGVSSNMDVSTASVLERLRYLPYRPDQPGLTQYETVAGPTFEGYVLLQAASSLLPTKDWRRTFIQIENGYLLSRKFDTDTSYVNRFPISFTMSSLDVAKEDLVSSFNDVEFTEFDMDVKIASEAINSAIRKRRSEVENHYKEFLENEIAEHVCKVVTPDNILIVKCESEEQRIQLIEGIERSLRPLLGEELWGQKVAASRKVAPVMKKQLFLQRYRIEMILKSLSDAGLVNACTSMLASGSKQFQGVVEITEIDVDGGTESANFFLILHDESLYWFDSSTSKRPKSYLPLSYASVSMDTNLIRNGVWSLTVKTLLRNVSFKAKHAVAMCEWLLAIQKTIDACKYDHRKSTQVPSDAGSSLVTPRSPRHKRLSLFSGMLRNVVSDTNSDRVHDDDSLLKDPEKNDISKVLARVIDLRVSGFTFQELLKSDESSLSVFRHFLDGTCEHTLLDCLLSIHTCAAKEPVQLAQAELLALRYLGKKSPDHLPHLPPEIGSAVENALASNQGALGINVFDDLKNWIVPRLETAFTRFKSTNQFRTVVQRLMQVGTDDRDVHGFDNPVSMQLALVLSNDQDKGRHVVTLDPGKSQVTLGRDESNDIVLNDKHVSRLHIRIAYSNSHAEVFDLGSSTGAIVNGIQTVHAPLLPGDTIVIGSTTIKFELRESRMRRGSRLLAGMLKRLGSPRTSSSANQGLPRGNSSANLVRSNSGGNCQDSGDQ